MQPGDILVAGRNFGCSSGRALAVKALQATGIGCVVAELFSRTFYRNAAEIGLPMLETPGIHECVETGHRLRVNVKTGLVENLTSGKSLLGNPPSEFMLDMVQAGGLIPLIKAGSSSHATEDRISAAVEQRGSGEGALARRRDCCHRDDLSRIGRKQSGESAPQPDLFSAGVERTSRLSVPDEDAGRRRRRAAVFGLCASPPTWRASISRPV